MHATRETYDNDELDWAFDEWVEIEEDHITRNCSAWRVPRPEGFWEVWRGWGDDAHERLYRSPAGQYFLGSVKCTGWAGRWWRDTEEVTHPYQDMAPWLADPLQAAPPFCLQYASLPGVESWGDVYRRAAAQPLEFMRIVAAAWFLCWPEGEWTEPVLRAGRTNSHCDGPPGDDDKRGAGTRGAGKKASGGTGECAGGVVARSCGPGDSSPARTMH